MRIKRATYGLFYLFLLLIVLEGFSRALFSVDSIVAMLRGYDEASWRLDWIRRHKKGTEIYYSFDAYDPTKGWISKPGLKDKTAFGDKILSTNSKGLRGNREYPYKKEPGKTRILVLGDSFTFGEGVSDDETYPDLLQSIFPNTDVINMGIHGYGHDQMLILLKEEGIRYKPDIVILGFVYIDIFRNGLSFRDYAKPRFMVERGGMRLVSSPVPPPREVLEKEWVRLKIVDLWTMLSHRVKERYGIKDREMRNLTRLILDEMVRAIEAVGAKPVFVYLPVGNEIVSNREVTWGEDFFFKYCKSDHELECFSLRPYFSEKVKQGRQFDVTGHWGRAEHRLVAEAIKDRLVKSSLIYR